MLKRVDKVEEDSEITGFSYFNARGAEESVQFTSANSNTIKISASAAFGGGGSDEIVVWREDVPNLIKALQAAYDHKEV